MHSRYGVARLACLVLALTLICWMRGPRALTTAQVPGTQVVTLAGTGELGATDGVGGAAQFIYPVGIAVDGAGIAYVVDGNRIRRVSSAGVVVSLAGGDDAGFTDGPASSARFSSPRGIAVDQAGTLYIADRDNHRIRTLSPQGVVATLAGSGTPGFADGPGEQAQFDDPSDVAVDTAGTVYVMDTLNYRVRRISPAGVVSTLAGGGEVGPDRGDYVDGPAAAARFSFATGLTVDAAGTVYVADSYGARIRAVSASGDVRTVAGSGEDGSADGPADQAQFSDPAALAADRGGNVYVLDKSNRVRMITPGGQVRTLAGTGEHGFVDGPAAVAQFDGPTGIAVDAAGTVYLADTGNRRIRLVQTGS